MEIDEGKELAVKLAKEKGSTFELISSKSQARAVTRIRREVIIALYAKDLRDWQIGKILNKDPSTIWAYRHLDQKKATSSAYKRRQSANTKDRAQRNHSGPGRDASKRQPSTGARPSEAVGGVPQPVRKRSTK